MAIKTFNVDQETYQKFADFCRSNGISASKQIEIFMKAQLEEKEKVRNDYLKTLEVIRKGTFVKIGNMEDFKKKYS